MENKKTVDQNLGEAVSTEENTNVVEETTIKTDGKEEVKIEQPIAEEAVAEEVVAEKVVAEEAVAEEAIAEKVVAEKVVAEEAVVEEVVAEKVVAEEAVVEEAVAEKVVAEEAVVEEAVTEEAVAEEVVAEEVVAEEPVVEAVSSEQEAETSDQKPEADSEEESGEDKAEVKEDKAEVKEDKAEVKEEEVEEEDELESFDELAVEELVSRLEELVQQEDITLIKTKVSLVKVAFLRIIKAEKKAAFEKFIEEGGNKDDYKAVDNKLEYRFNKAFDIYRRNKIKFNELQDKLKLVNLEKKKEILEKLKELISSEETLKKTYDEFKNLQTKWKESGMVPSGEVSNLWQSYHFLVEKFFDKVKINKELRDLDMKKNLELKVELCEKTEELLLETSIIKSFKQLQKYHDDWKDIGPVPQEQNDEIWERFKAATDKINERRREHYGKVQEDQEQNLLAKNGLCEQAEELLTTTPTDMKGWQEQSNKMNELFKIWRTIGRAPKKENTEVWDRFKGSMNSFFNNKKEFLNSIKQEQLNNYNLKVDLCAEAESLKDNTDWKKTTQDLIRLQQEWKKIGPVPRKHADKIWKRFRLSCDEFFSNKAKHFSSIHENENENLEKKQALIEKVKSFEFGKDKSKNLDILKDFQREWMSIGYIPMKEKEKMQKAFRAVIDARLDELKISSTEFSNASYASRMEAVKDSPDAGRVYRKEIGYMTNKISSLRDDINLWENNLGFFANSKQADILKQEFEQKIEKAKQDLAAMEAKVKYLRQMSND